MREGRVFFDTNILVYCFDDAAAKRNRAVALVEGLGQLGLGVISFQVQNEFAAVAIRRIRDKAEIQRRIQGLHALSEGVQVVQSSEGLFQRAVGLWERYSLAWYDSLIIAAGLEGRCDVLYSEDLQDGLEIDGMRIVNPFRV
jgi:predicted nucleic acid-binding protein